MEIRLYLNLCTKGLDLVQLKKMSQENMLESAAQISLGSENASCIMQWPLLATIEYFHLVEGIKIYDKIVRQLYLVFLDWVKV